jgi:hypothetical protein
MSNIEERLDRLEKEVRRLKRMVAEKSGGRSGGEEEEIIMEKDGVYLIKAGDLFGSYVVVDRDGTTHMYADRKAAERTFRILAERPSSGTPEQG